MTFQTLDYIIAIAEEIHLKGCRPSAPVAACAEPTVETS